MSAFEIVAAAMLAVSAYCVLSGFSAMRDFEREVAKTPPPPRKCRGCCGCMPKEAP